MKPAKGRTGRGQRAVDSKSTPGTEDSSRVTVLREKIMQAARGCFERWGIGKTTIEDIAHAAGVSRPTLYKYFSGKEELVDLISIEESIAVNAEVRRRIVKKSRFDEMMTEALFHVLRISNENPYLRLVIEYGPYQSKVAGRDSNVHKMHYGLWGRFLEQARIRGELAPDLDIDEVLTWMTLAEGMILAWLQQEPVADADLRRLIRRFIVDPLIAR